MFRSRYGLFREYRDFDSGKQRSGEHVIDMGTDPGWVGRHVDIRRKFHEIESGIRDLEDMVRRKLMPGFHSKKHIQTQTLNIRKRIEKQISECEQMIGEIHRAINDGKSMDSTGILAENVRKGLVDELKELVGKYRILSQHSITPDQPVDEVSNEIKDGSPMMETEDHHRVDVEDMRDIHQSIVEVATIMKNLETMVSDQDSLLDRIDSNLEHMCTKTVQGMNELIRREKRSSTKFRSVAKVFLGTVGLLVVVLVAIH